MSIRSFVALSLPQDIANQLGDMSAKMSYLDKSRALKWVDQENYHTTLAFLGDQTTADLDALAETLDENLLQTEFEASVSQISPFPESKPKLLAALLEKSDVLDRIHKQVTSSVYACGLLMDKRKFNPHVTLARYRHSKVDFVNSVHSNVDMKIVFDEVVIYESILTSRGAEYEPIYRFPLDLYDENSDQY